MEREEKENQSRLSRKRGKGKAETGPEPLFTCRKVYLPQG
jgi:hypothetical protein